MYIVYRKRTCTSFNNKRINEGCKEYKSSFFKEQNFKFYNLFIIFLRDNDKSSYLVEIVRIHSGIPILRSMGF